MFFILVSRALLQDIARSVRVVFAIALGAAVTTSVLAVSVGIGDKVERELTSYGANIEIVSAAGRSHPQSMLNLGGIRYTAGTAGATIPVNQLGQIKTVFWRHNILAFAPFLSSTFDVGARPVRIVGTWFNRRLSLPGGGVLSTGARVVQPWWRVTGAWPADQSTNDCLVGASLAQELHPRAGSLLHFDVNGENRTLRVTGLLHTGGAEDEEVVAPIGIVQSWTGQPGMASRVEVSALVKPDDALAHKNPATLTPADRERLICSPYIGQITSELEGVLPGVEARPVYRVADSQGKLLGRIQLLMAFVLVAAFFASVLGAGSATAAAALQRRQEIGLIKALGAPLTVLGAQFMAEAVLLGLAGAILGVPVGLLLNGWIGRMVFGSAGAIPWIVIPVGLALSLVIAVGNSMLPLWAALRVDPVLVLNEEG